MFIAVDGIDGAGKTTLVNSLGQILSEIHPLLTKEPTDHSHWGEQLRNATVNGRLPRKQEVEFFHQDRLHHIKDEIQPALDQGRWVISDRYVDSTLAFQADSPADADLLYAWMSEEILTPDITFILDCSVKTGLERIKARRNGRTTFEIPKTLERARAIYESRSEPHHVHINASGGPEQTLEQAIAAIKDRLDENDRAMKLLDFPDNPGHGRDRLTAF